MDKLITTKLLIPPTSPGLVSRQRLIDRLNSFIFPGSRLILVTAPAGYGKTTLVTDWLSGFAGTSGTDRESGIEITWFSIDDGDNDPARFLSYLDAALNQVEGVITSYRRDSWGLLQSPQPHTLEQVFADLINDIASLPLNIILVLDDFHLIENNLIHDALGFFLENLPPQLHLVIATREDPQLPLSRLRSRGQLSELRASDLRFRTSEAADYLNRTMGLNLSSASVASLEDRTEGWIAGLQLAALSMRGSPDASGLIKAFTGSHRLVQDFLIDEVLSRQPEDIQNFLLQTSILDKLTGSICEYLTHQSDSQKILEHLERANLFIIPQDNERHSFRYHHLFAELLRLRLQQSQPGQISLLHSRASSWYEDHQLPNESIRHALRAQEPERAIDLIEKNIEEIWAEGEYTKLNRWLKRLPEELVLSRPQLCIFRAWELYASGRPLAGEQLLQEAGLVESPAQDQIPGGDSTSREQDAGSMDIKVRGRAAALQAWMAAWRRDNFPGLIQHLEHALNYLPDQDMQWRSAIAITLADTHAINGDLTAAYHARLIALKECEAAGNSYLYLFNSAKLALNLRLRGKLSQAQELCKERVDHASKIGLEGTAVVGWLRAIWGDILAETGHLDEAYQMAQKSYRVTKTSRDLMMLGWSSLAMTRILFSRGDYAGAERVIQELDSAAQGSLMPTWIKYQNEAWLSRILLSQEKLEAAAQWARERQMAVDQSSIHFEAYKILAIARIMIALGEQDEAIPLLDGLQESSQIGNNLTRLIEVLLLQALAFKAGGEVTQALGTLERALSLAEAGGFFQIFVDEGPPLASLLYLALERGLASSYVSRLLQAFPTQESRESDPTEHRSVKDRQIEPLSEREIEVLQMIAAGLTNPQIADRLVLSLHTVKVHARNIYSKLDVSNRTEAVSKARTLGILADT